MRNVIEILLNAHRHRHSHTLRIISSSSIGDKEVDEQPQMLRAEQDALFSYVHIFVHPLHTHRHVQLQLYTVIYLSAYSCFFSSLVCKVFACSCETLNTFGEYVFLFIVFKFFYFI